jgi:hypothetical protein
MGDWMLIHRRLAPAQVGVLQDILGSARVRDAVGDPVKPGRCDWKTVTRIASSERSLAIVCMLFTFSLVLGDRGGGALKKTRRPWDRIQSVNVTVRLQDRAENAGVTSTKRCCGATHVLCHLQT